MKITNLIVRDIRFPTSLQQDGSDALNQGDYSATYVVLETGTELEGHGLTFTNGRGNEIVVTAVHALKRHVVGRDFDGIVADMRSFYRDLTTSTGWLGYPHEKVRRLCREAIAQGWTAFKMKVGQNLEDNAHRAALMREEIGWERKLMMDANQCWDVEESITQMKALARFDPWRIEEPTSPDDVLGHARIAREIAPIAVATGEVCHNRVMFKQLLQRTQYVTCRSIPAGWAA